MSTTTTPNDSPLATPIQPLHNPSQAAQVVVPQAPLGNVANKPGMAAKALLAKKFAKAHNPTYISPTDNFMTPVTQKLNAAKKKQFSKGTKSVQLFARKDNNVEHNGDSDEEMTIKDVSSLKDQQKVEVDEENPF